MNYFDAKDALAVARDEATRAEQRLANALKTAVYYEITRVAPEATHISMRVLTEDNNVVVDWLDLSGETEDDSVELPQDGTYDRIVALIDEVLAIVYYDDPIVPLTDNSQEPQPLSIFLER